MTPYRGADLTSMRINGPAEQQAQGRKAMSLDRLVSVLPVLVLAYALVMVCAAVSVGVQWYRESRTRRRGRSAPTVVTGRNGTIGGVR